MRSPDSLRPAILLVFAVLYVLLVPPLEAPDEPAHFLRAYGIAEGQWLLEDHPTSLIAYLVEQAAAHRDINAIPAIADIKKELGRSAERMPNVAFNVVQYSPVPYLLDAALIRAAMTLDLGPQAMLYLCRMATALIFVLLMTLAFRLCEACSWPLFWVAATPMALTMASVVSPDPLVLGSSALVLAAALGELRPRTYALCLVPALFILIQTKPPYLPLVLAPAAALLWTSDHRRWRSLILLGATLLGIAGEVAWSSVVRSRGILDALLAGINRYRSVGVEPARQTEHLLSSPDSFLSVISNTLSRHGASLFRELVGVLGWQDVPLPPWVAIAWGILAAVIIVLAKRPPSLPWPGRLAVGGATLIGATCAAALVFAAIYVVWMPVGADTVYLQGRYFLPLAAAFLIAVTLLTPRPRRLPEIALGWTMILAALAFNVTAAWTLLQRYYLSP